MGELQDGVQAYFFSRWPVGYIRTNPLYRGYSVHFGQRIISCLREKVSNESQDATSGEESANQIKVDCLVTNAVGDIVLLVKLETASLGSRQITEIVKTISSCHSYEVLASDQGQYFYPIPDTRYIIAGVQSGRPEAAKHSINHEILVEEGLVIDSLIERLNDITIVTAENGCVLGMLKRAIAKLMPRYSKPRDTISFQTLVPPKV